MSGASVVRLEPGERRHVFDGVVRQSVHGERMSVAHYVMEAGGRFPDHEHDQEQITVLIRGGIEFVVEGTRFLLEPYDMILIPAGAPHEAAATSEGAEVLSFVSPARRGDDDYVLRTSEGG